MFGRTKHSFKTKLIVAASATVVFVQLIGAVFDVYASYTRLSDEMDARGQLVATQTSGSISQPMWDFDETLVREIMDSLRSIADFSHVSIITPTGETELELRTAQDVAATGIRRYASPIVVKDGGVVEILGSLEVGISTAGLYSSLSDVTVHKSAVVLATLWFASGVLYFILGRLSKPLEDLRASVFAIERGDFDHCVAGLTRKDEIGALANALDGLREREAELTSLRHTNTEKNRREGKRIQQALNSTRDAVVLLDEHDNIVFINAPAKTYFSGLLESELRLERRHQKRSRLEDIRKALLSRLQMDAEITVTLHGAVRHFQARTGPVTDSEGNDLGSLFIASDFTEQFENSKKASYLASHDPLTGLLNRRQMDTELAGWGDLPDETIGIMLLDLDHFKSINDTLGHQLGDALLVSIARMMRELSGPGDLVIRLGGDEFAIVVHGLESEMHLGEIATRAVKRLQKPMELGDRSIEVSVSAGIAQLPMQGWSIDTLMRHADLALYEAKQAGRGRFEVYKDALSATHERREKMKAALQLALDTDDIFPVFQMQTAIDDGSIAGFEALARWQDGEMGMISPGEFIPLAENAGLIASLTRKILGSACEAAMEWRGYGFKHKIAVNISPKLFDGEVVALVKGCLKRTGCSADMIELEITESVLLSNSDTVRLEIDALREMGLSIALDDFGVGYSSLDYLRRFPVDKIKIDRAFVRDIAVSEQSRAIVTAISQLGHSLGMNVTGEGAETLEDRLALKRCGVDVVQGFVDGRPAIKSEAEQALFTQGSSKLAAQ